MPRCCSIRQVRQIFARRKADRPAVGGRDAAFSVRPRW